MAGDLILGIESSCDDTSVGVVDRSGRVYANVVSSQAALHTQYGGVYPQLASREHLKAVIPTIQHALLDAEAGPDDISTIAVTRAPGLIGSLMVGVDTARALGEGWCKPVVGVNHLRGHIRSADLEEQRISYPAMVLLVSGGHTILAHMRSVHEIELLGSTRDDSVGESYDKTSRMLGRGYPGGPIIDEMARHGKSVHRLPSPLIGDGLDFSFSGLKTAVQRLIEEGEAEPNNVAASFVDAVLSVMVTKVSRALRLRPSACLVVVGGVAASPQLRLRMQEVCDVEDVELCLPPIRWSTDNGAMIAMAGWDYVTAGIWRKPTPSSRLSVVEW